jgi:prepilin-type N-terminal cleavage/methylation domain-containing protein
VVAQRQNTFVSRPGNRGGFTLIELLTVLVVLGIASAIAMPSLSAIGTARAAGAQRQIVRDMTYARERAIATGTLHRVVFSTASNNYSLFTVAGTNPAGTTQTALSLPGSGAPFVQNLSTGEFAGSSITSVSIGGGSSVTFDWSGTAYASSGAVLSADATVTLAGPRRVILRGQSYLIEAVTP